MRPQNCPQSKVFLSCGLASLLAFAFTGCDFGGTRVDGSGTAASEERSPGAATGVVVHAIGTLIVTQGPASLQVSADDNILPLLLSEVRDGVLVLGPEDNIHIDPETPIVYRLTLPNLESVEASGATRVDIGAVTAERFTLRASGSAGAEAESIRAEPIHITTSGSSSAQAHVETASLEVRASGSSSVEVTGSAGAQELDASGSADVDASGLTSRRAQVNLSGSAGAFVDVDESLRVSGSGASHVRYRGDATLRQSLSGAASVEQVE